MYDSDTTTVISTLQGSSAAVFSDKTIANILALTTTADDSIIKIDNSPTIAPNGQVTFTSGTELGFVEVTDDGTALIIDGGTSTIILGGTGSANVQLGAPTDTVVSGNTGASAAPAAASAEGVTDRVVIHSAGADKFTVNDGKNNLIVVGGDDTVIAGSGYDTVVAAEGHSTIVGGSKGQTVVEAAGNEDDYVVTVVDGRAVAVNNTNGIGIDVSKVQYVQVDDGNALIFAENVNEASVATLYETIFGRAADASGLQFWFDKIDAGTGLTEIAKAFMGSAEYLAQEQIDNTAFLESMYQNTFGRAGEEAGITWWLDAMERGVTRADVANVFASTAAYNLDGTLNNEANIVGSITIVDGIV